MRRITLWLTGTVFLVVLLFTYRTSTSGPTGVSAGSAAYAPGVVSGPGTGAGSVAGGAGSTTDTGSGSGSGSGSGTGTGTGTGSSPGAGGGAAGGSADTVVNGTVAQTRWGPVQVQVHVSGGKIVDVVVLQQPSGNQTDREINSYALPELRAQVLQAQSAQIDGVSGATVTSDGYRETLQSALALVHIG